ncbi:hypothetical protein BJV78DRAFT_1285224 [Lactifluus subvellereus]|nr:hypothetical protein BJV78DRAFT_1285224 [Lactifluus subvellereus]
MLSFTYLLRLPPATCEIKTNGVLWRRISDPASLFSQYERTFGPVRRLKLLTNAASGLRSAFAVSSSAGNRHHPAESLPPPHRRIALHFSDISLRLDDVLCLEIRIRVTYRGAVDGLIQVLSTQRERRPGQTQLLFPDLRSVKLSLVDLDEAVVPPPRTRGDLLVEGLARRRDLGFGIQELEVSDRDGRWMSRLQAIVPGVAHADI